eukprot:8367194-Alexandrium_andersonii.AAC.1
MSSVINEIHEVTTLTKHTIDDGRTDPAISLRAPNELMWPARRAFLSRGRTRFDLTQGALSRPHRCTRPRGARRGHQR